MSPDGSVCVSVDRPHGSGAFLKNVRGKERPIEENEPGKREGEAIRPSMVNLLSCHGNLSNNEST